MNALKDISDIIRQKNKDRPENIIKGIDPVAVSLIKQMYSALIDRGANVTLYEKVWINQLEKIYSDKETFDQFFIHGLETLLKQAYYLLADKTTPWDIKKDELLTLAQRILFLKGREDTFKEFYDDLEQIIIKAIQLDFSGRINLIEIGKDKANIFSYKAAIINTLLDTLETSVVSSHSVDELISQITGTISIITDLRGKIKFINTLGSNTLTGTEESLLKQSIERVLPDYRDLYDELIQKGTIRDRKINLTVWWNQKIIIPAILNVSKSKTQSTVEEVVYLIKVQQFETSINELNLKQQLHDKIAPLNTLLSGLHILSKRLIDKDSQQLINGLLKTTTGLRERNMSELGELATKTEDRIEEVNIEELIDEVVNETGLISQLAGGEIVKNIGCSTLLTKRKYFYSIVQNILSNAFKYSDKRRTLKIDVKCLQYKKNEVLLEITDNGVGLKQSQLVKVLALSQNIRKSIKGSGLGLSIVAEYVKLLNGRIEIKSALGKGTTFSIFLPIIKEKRSK